MAVSTGVATVWIVRVKFRYQAVFSIHSWVSEATAVLLDQPDDLAELHAAAQADRTMETSSTLGWNRELGYTEAGAIAISDAGHQLSLSPSLTRK